MKKLIEAIQLPESRPKDIRALVIEMRNRMEEYRKSKLKE